MSDAEFDDATARWSAAYAENLVAARGLDLEQARLQAGAEYRAQLPEGRRTDGQLCYLAIDENDRSVGALWLGTASPDGAAAAWVHELEVDPAWRGRGYGRQLMTLAESVCRERGIGQLRLNVFGSNAVARRLYDSLGYTVLYQRMAKDL